MGLINHGYSVIDLWHSSDVSITVFNYGGFGQLALESTGVPETSTWVMTLVGFGAMGAAIRVTRRKNGVTLVR